MIRHIQTTKDGFYADAAIAKGAVNDDTLTFGEKQQKVEGFGSCFNELCYEALKKADPEQRRAYMKELFSPDEMHFTQGRVPIGASDFSCNWYSCDETDGDYELKDFSIERDKMRTIPFIKEAQEFAGPLHIFGSPWSPPTWMKTKPVYNFGRLRMEDAILKTYAQYFVKFVQEYAKEGVNVEQVFPQNEPMADQKFASCLWYGEDMRRFIGDYLGPAFEEAGMDTEIWMGTVNGPFNDVMMTSSDFEWTEYYDQFDNTILSDPKVRKYVKGVGVQWGGKHIVEQIRASYPELRYKLTESECGDGQNTWTSMEYIYRQMWHYFRHGAEAYIYWNIALETDNVSTWGWRQNALAIVDPETGNMTRTPEFYLMKHFSAHVQPGAHVLSTFGHLTTNTVAFENPDGSLVLVIGCAMDKDREYSFTWKGETYSVTLPPHSIHTIVVD